MSNKNFTEVNIEQAVYLLVSYLPALSPNTLEKLLNKIAKSGDVEELCQEHDRFVVYDEFEENEPFENSFQVAGNSVPFTASEANQGANTRSLQGVPQGFVNTGYQY